ncbi:hypothetical protein A3C89_04300 [Candidatus Kaiserbacteria bacterium RIFCSPHIGHO2_02_FULL_50_50]|uniref:Uncharacterized protein n=1 Tax=Candidatus Kaiserbacteria bacterium RIFCSPHIGHO2_02_FULL_50_50 TaxID=1798492 RepID=A0A1F6DDJ0_9BACT|nr:MAG: hypothetical protein A3C89_04300 [Candidatus Kaiserbacteria bacterium RIFCSPHIGHO2_02_FULL_50_50]OGG88405.1 MAG: hypothetical protein A3G62_02280 [Candidatus Kaiserbacteria bacterium RIFCSPLOWO2_12_FULL_50_10]
MKEIFERVLKEISKDKNGETVLVLLVRNDGGGWDFVYSAEWIDGAGFTLETLKYVTDIIDRNKSDILITTNKNITAVFPVKTDSKFVSMAREYLTQNRAELYKEDRMGIMDDSPQFIPILYMDYKGGVVDTEKNKDVEVAFS